jgi:hypothetical protein
MTIPKQFVITRYRHNTCGMGGGTTLTSFKDTVNTKATVAVARKALLFLHTTANKL